MPLWARQLGSSVVGVVGVEPPLDGTRGQCEGLSAYGGLDGLEVQTVDGARTYERLYLGDDFGLEGFLEPPFLASASDALSLALHNCSLVSIISRTTLRKRRYSAICALVTATASDPITRVTVLPRTSRVSDQLGPWPSEPSAAQWQPALPHRR